MTASVGTGASFSLANSPTNFFAEVLSLAHSGVERPSIDVSHLATTGGRDFIPGDLVDWGQLELELLLDETALPPMLTAAGACVVTFKGGSTWTWTGFGMNWSTTNPFEDRVTSTLTVKISGDLVIA